MRLSELSLEQAAALRGLIAVGHEHSEVTLNGHLKVQAAERGYDVVSAIRADLGRSVVARYAPVVLEVGATRGPQRRITDVGVDIHAVAFLTSKTCSVGEAYLVAAILKLPKNRAVPAYRGQRERSRRG